MRSYSLLWVFIPMMTLYACSHAGNRDYETSAVSDDTTALSPEPTDARKRIKTADIRCRVNDVISVTSRIERLVASLNGIVVESNFRNEQNGHQEYPWSADSLKSITHYTPVARLTLKVPARHLDSVVHALTGMSARISHRVLKDTDVMLQYLRNELQNKASEIPVRDTAHTQKEKELDISRYEETKRTQAIDRTIANMSIDDEVALSAITVELFQPEVAEVQVILNPEHLSKPPLGMAALTAWRSGAEFFRGMLLFFLRIWPAFVIGTLVWYGYRKLAVRK